MIKEREYYLDYLRAFLIFLVVLLHITIAYTLIAPSIIPWWVPENAGSFFFDIISFGLDIFIMPLMFFVAGYFTYPSWKKRTPLVFLKHKAFHLLVPFILGVILLDGYPNYLLLSLKHKIPTGFLNYYLNDYLSHILFYLKNSKASVHLWFLPCLFLFYVIWALIHPLVLKINSLKTSSFVGLALITGFLFSLIHAFIPDYQPWVTYFDILTIQRTRAPLYIFYFLFGVVYFRNQDKWTCSHLGRWALGSLLVITLNLSFLFYYQLHLASHLQFPQWIPYRAMHGFLHSFAAASMLVVLMTFFKRYLNKPSKFGAECAHHSYAIYILHFNYALFAEKMFLTIEWPIYQEVVAILLFTLVASYLSSKVLQHVPFLKRAIY